MVNLTPYVTFKAACQRRIWGPRVDRALQLHPPAKNNYNMGNNHDIKSTTDSVPAETKRVKVKPGKCEIMPLLASDEPPPYRVFSVESKSGDNEDGEHNDDIDSNASAGVERVANILTLSATSPRHAKEKAKASGDEGRPRNSRSYANTKFMRTFTGLFEDVASLF